GLKIIPPDVRDDLVRRNVGKTISFQAYHPRSSQILLRKSADLKRIFKKRVPEADEYLLVTLPGYSSDGNTAVVKFYFGPHNFHGDHGWSLLVKQDGKWIVKWKDFTAYM